MPEVEEVATTWVGFLSPMPAARAPVETEAGASMAVAGTEVPSGSATAGASSVPAATVLTAGAETTLAVHAADTSARGTRVTPRCQRPDRCPAMLNLPVVFVRVSRSLKHV